MLLGKRRVRAWSDTFWVTARNADGDSNFLILPDEGRKFEVTAHSNKALDDEIGKGLRHQFPGR